jgi:hypothetical protein
MILTWPGFEQFMFTLYTYKDTVLQESDAEQAF